MTSTQEPMADAPVWFTREWNREQPDGEALRMLVLHWDDYPTARAVYLECLPRRGHHVVFLERSREDSDGFDVSLDGTLEHVITPSWPTPSSGDGLFTRASIKLRRVRGWLRRFAWVWARTGREDFDFVQARDLLPETWIAYLVARMRGTRFAYQLDFQHYEGRIVSSSGNGLRSIVWRIESRIGRAVRDAFIRRADVVFVISEAMREQYVRRGFREDRLHVFPVGVGRRFLDAAPRREQRRAELGLDDATPVVVYLGNLGFTRDADFILDVLAQTTREDAHVKIMILGRNSEALDEKIDARDLRDRLVFVGTVPYDEVPEYLVAADVGIHPIPLEVPFDLHRTMSPLKVSEYMASGLAVVASPIEEARDLLERSGGGVVVPYATTDFVRAILAYARDRGRGREAGRRGQDYVHRYKTFDRLADLVERAYRSHLGARGGRVRA